jgi:DNA-binding CsgD family transcriptional regulator
VEKDAVQISEKEKQFLQYACTDMTYKQIAAAMFLSERTIDGYREALFGKLKVQSRVGLAMEAIRKGLVSL